MQDLGMHHRLNVPALLAIMVGVSMVTLDISLTSTALPTIATGLGVAPATTIWIINVYYLSVIASLLPLATVGEIFGHRKVFVVGLVIFAAGALASGLASSLPMLIGGRALLGIGSAAVSATTPALIRFIYPIERIGRGLGLYALVVGVAFSAGPPVASAILAVADWPWLFLLNVPVALIALALASKRLPETDRSVRSFDGVSALLCAATFSCLLFAIAGAAHLGPMPVIIALACFAFCGAVLWRRDAGRSAPILGADLFRIPIFALSSLTSICSFSVQGLMFVVLPFLFQFRMGFSQVEAGLLIIPWPASLIVMTIIASRLSDRIQPGLLGGIGLLILTAGLATIATIPFDSGFADIAWRLVLCGIGFGFFQSPNMAAIMRSAPRARSGSAGGILAMSRLLGQSVGAAIVAFCLSTWPETGVEIAIWLGAGFALIGCGTSFARLIPSIRAKMG